MRPEQYLEKLIRRLRFKAGADLHERTISDAMQAQAKSKKTKSVAHQPNIWRIIMKTKIAKLTTAAVVIIAVIFGLTAILDHGTATAYAVTQTIEAIKEVKTVYMTGEFYKQGKFECWMKFDGDPDKPTHIWLGRTGVNVCKICSPEGVFGLNKRTKVVRFAPRDERDKHWFIKFGSFFEDAVKKSGTNDAVKICEEQNDKTSKSTIVVYITTPKREQKFLVDPETKLPISFTTVRDDDPMEMVRKTLAVKHLTEICYNEQPPEGIFDMPTDARITEEEVDCLVDPDSGLIVDGMTREEACLAIAKQTCQALVDLDIHELKSLALLFRSWPAQAWEGAEEMKSAGKWVQGYQITGEPYQEGKLWYVPCELKSADDKTEINTPMIKFYDMEGHTYAFIIGSKEKGVVD